MLITKKAYVKWNSRNKRHYVECGYEYTKMGDSLLVNVNDLTRGSTAVVTLKCDYCGREYEIMWQTYVSITKRELIHKDACCNCCELKSKEAIENKYGGHKELYENVKEKTKKTNMEKYGCFNVFQNEDIKKKIIETNIEKYGVPYNQQNINVRNKTKRTCLEKYGVENYIELFKGKFIKENSPVWKGGSQYSRVERATHEYIMLRKDVFSRDKYTCQCCGNKSTAGNSVELHAHHILNWKDNKDKRYDTNNGITLCSSCHYMFHSKYGKNNNNLDQLNEFLSLMLDKKVC